MRVLLKVTGRNVICFLLYIYALPASAQLKGIVSHYSTENGLSHDGVLCITRDKEGFMWFGTWDGLNRFDGNNFVVYKSHPGDRSNLKNNKIRNIVEDQAGYLWVKTYDRKIYRFDKRTEKFLSVPEESSLKNLIVDKIIPVSNGNTWLTTANQGLLCAVNHSSSPKPSIYKYARSMKGGFHIPSDKINFLFEDKQKKIWVGTSAGLCRMGFDNSAKQYQKAIFADKTNVFGSSLSFTCAVQDGDTVYFGTAQGVLVIFNSRSGKFTMKTLAKGVKVNDLRLSRSKRNLYGTTTGKGLISIDLSDLRLRFLQPAGNNTYHALYEDKSGRLWIEPENDGVVKYDPKTQVFKVFTQKREPYLLSPNKNFMVFEDVNGTLWARLKGGGFGYYNHLTDQLDYFYDEPGTANKQFSNIVTALYPDKTGILWLSTVDAGLVKIISPRNNFNHKLPVENAVNNPENEVRALFEDSKKRIWVGTKAGHLSVLKDGINEESIFVNMSGAMVGNVYTIMEDADGKIWIGTKGKGLLVAEPLDQSKSKYKLTRYLSVPADPYSLSHNDVYSVIQDKKGRIWIGTFGGGLNQALRQGAKIKFRNNKNSFSRFPLSCLGIRHLCEGPLGKIWIASKEGLVIFNPEGNADNYRFLKYNKIPGDRSSLGNNEVQFIHHDGTGKMWVGTFGGGLNQVISNPASEKLAFRIYTREEGLPNDIILSIEEDRRGDLWLSTKNGLSRYDRKAGTFKNYDSYDGLPETEFSESASFRSFTGEMYFGCKKGYISFDPAKIYNRKVDARMVLTNIQLYNNDLIIGAPDSLLKYALNHTDLITLDYDQNVINIDYAVLDYRASHKINYVYILKGYDKGWHYVKNQQRATYTNLPPGDYEFYVKAANNELFNNVPVKKLMVTILPPPWLTWWAYGGYFILALILIAAARRVIVTMIMLRNKVIIEGKLTELKLSFFTNISHELRTPLTLIISPLEQLNKNEHLSNQEKENINIISRNANRMERFINQLLDFRKIQSGKMRLHVAEVDVVMLIKEIAWYFRGISNERNIDLQISSVENELFAWVDDEKIDIIFYNLISNAFKFSPDNTSIRIHIDNTKEEEYFSITVADQGHGIPKEKLAEIFELYYEGDNTKSSLKGTGIGLALSKELVQAHKGTISASNNPEGGVTFILRFRKGRSHFNEDEVNFTKAEKSFSLKNVSAPENEHVDEPPVIHLQEGQNKKQLVLLVEDNSELRRFLANQFSSYYEVMEAADGKEGYVVAVDQLPDLIISDVMMPNMDGIQMLDQLKNNTDTSHIPVILLTARSSVENQIDGLKYGADFYITKPFQISYVLALVENLLKQRKEQFEFLLGHDKKLVSLNPDKIIITSKDETFLKHVIRIVEEGMGDCDFNIESVAESVGIGRTTFYKKLKGLTGLAPVEFARDMRLKRSKQLLDVSEYTISEIAYMTGFRSLGYFSTCFKEKYRISPSGYLKNNKNMGMKPSEGRSKRGHNF